MKPLTRNFLVAAFFFFVALPSSFGATDNPPRDEAETLRAEKAALWNTVNRLNKENAALKTEIERLKARLEKVGGDTRELPSPTPVQGEESGKTTQDSAKDGNTAIARAVNEYIEAMRKREAEKSLTDLQRRTKWLEVTQRLDRILCANRVLVSYIIEDVQFDTKTGTALLDCSSASIKPVDPTVPEFVFREFYLFRIVATQAQALKITAGSAMKVEGKPALNVDYSKPAADQPKVHSFGEMPGYRPLGKVYKSSDVSYNYTTMDGFVTRGSLVMMIAEDCAVTVDGVRRNLPSTKPQASADKATTVRDRPQQVESPPIIRVEPRIIRPGSK